MDYVIYNSQKTTIRCSEYVKSVLHLRKNGRNPPKRDPRRNRCPGRSYQYSAKLNILRFLSYCKCDLPITLWLSVVGKAAYLIICAKNPSQYRRIISRAVLLSNFNSFDINEWLTIPCQIRFASADIIRNEAIGKPQSGHNRSGANKEFDLITCVGNTTDKMPLFDSFVA